MLDRIREQLLGKPEKIQELLELYGFANVKIHQNYISFGRNEDSSPKAIVLWLDDNRYCYIKDFARNISKDIFGFLMMKSGDTFGQVLNKIKAVLDITDWYMFSGQKREVFGGFYKNIKRKYAATALNIYPEDILIPYEAKGNIRFLRDHISLETQRYFGIRFDVENNGIVIPVRDQLGNLVGIKIRNNWESDEPGFKKYWYSVPVSASQTLYGYCQNYPNLIGNDVMLFESEKSVMQAYSYHYGNALALGSGSLSNRQAQMILELNPKSVIFLHDQGFDKEGLHKNMETLMGYARFFNVPVKYWDWEKGEYPEKCSPTDLGKNEFRRILCEELVRKQ